MSEKYQGWTNHETWVVNLWISNDEPLYMYMQDVDLTSAEKCEIFYKYGVGNNIKRSILKDIADGDIKNVNWQELSDAWTEE